LKVNNIQNIRLLKLSYIMPIILNDYSIDYWITGNIIDCGKSNHPKDEEISKGQEDQNLEFMINYIIADTNPLKHHYDIKPSRVDINDKPKFQTDMHNKQRNKFKGKNPHNYALSLQTKQINNSIVYNEEKLNSHFRKSFQKIYSNNKKNHINKENYTDFLFNNKILSYDKI